MMYFTKLSCNLTRSSLWNTCDAEVRCVWIAMLSLKDKNGDVFSSLPGLANEARVSIEVAERALAVFKAPDPYSQNKDHEGRRIVDIDGGWHLISHAHYQDDSAAETRREQVREAVRRHRESKGKPKATKTPALDDAQWWEAMKGKFPALDLDAERRGAEAWLLANPGRQFTRAFFVRWCLRASSRTALAPRSTAPQAGASINSVAQADSVIAEISSHIAKLKADPGSWVWGKDRWGDKFKEKMTPEAKAEYDSACARLDDVRKKKTGLT